MYFIIIVLAFVICLFVASYFLREKLRPLFIKAKDLLSKVDWEALYNKAQQSGIIDKFIVFINSKKKGN